MPLCAAERRERCSSSGDLAGAAEDVAEPVVHPESDENTHGDEGEQLHDRLERDGRDQAFVALGGIEMAGAEQDGERGKQHRDVEGVVAEERAARLACPA